MQGGKKTKRSIAAEGAQTAAEPAVESMEVDNKDDGMNMSDDEEGGTRIGDIYIPPPVEPYCSTESVGPRLIITKISNKNFKSYAGEVWLGPFFHRFHAVIGPNGSGKSNVIDSMLFVFGYRANKIRCKKLSVLLHSSTKFPNTTSCRVAVHFALIVDNPDGTYEELPDSSFFISRTAFRDNSSFYTINDKKVHFKEVSKLLKQHKVDLDNNRFLILQGEVESIAMMKPKGLNEGECGLLEYLEDIVGTSRYKEPLMKINNRVDALTDERTEKHNRCKLAEREMNDLKQPMEEAIEYLKLENELTRTKNLQIQKYVSEEHKHLQVIEAEHVDHLAVVKTHDDKYDDIKKQRIEKERTIKEEIEKYDSLVKKRDEYVNMLKKAKSKYDEIQSSMDSTNKRRKQFKTQLKKEEDNLVELLKIPSKNSGEIADCEKKIEQLTKQKQKFEETLQVNLEALQNEIKPFIEKKETLQTELINLKKDVDECKAAVSIAESELKMCKMNETAEKRKYETLKNSYNESKQSYEEKQVRFSELEQMIPELKTELTEKNENLLANKQQEQTLGKQLQTLRQEISEKQNSMKMAKSNNRVLDELMKQKMEGRIPGILGRLGDLGGIDAKYDVAISTCCGRLDNIVVDTVNTAQKCIEHIKRVDAGRATFIAIEKVSHLADRAATPIQTPENAPRLFDLIRVEDSRVSAAFYFALRDTLVANELDQGTRIAYGKQRFRVVTLKGDVIETSGTMSGGGRNQMRGRMGQTVKTKTSKDDSRQSMSRSDMEAMQQKELEMRAQLSGLQEEQGQLERDIRQATQSLKQKESEIQRMQINMKSFADQLPHIAEQLKRQQKKMEQTQADPERVKELEETIAEKQKLYKQSESAAKKVTDQVKNCEQKITDITGDKVKSVEKKIEDADKQIVKMTKHVFKLNVEVTSSERNVKKSEEKIESLKSEIKIAEETLVKSSEERTQADTDTVELEERIKKGEEDIATAQKGSSSVKKEFEALQKEESDGKMKRVELEQKLKVLEKKINDLNDLIPYWKNKLKPLKLQDIPQEPDPEPLKTYTEEELASYKLQDVQYKCSVIEEDLKSKTPNLSVIADYLKKREAYLERVQFLEEITNKRNEMRQLYDDVRKKRYTEFIQGFNIITKKLKEVYQMITQGGDAELELVDSMDPFSEGVSFSVRPPKKSWKNISNLSGGEKTLSSLALVFALHYYKPSPLYFMDEIDAALDFRNVSIVANYIKSRTKNAQFIIISLRSNMFELADFLSGIYKVNDCTQSVTIENEVPDQMVVQYAPNTQTQQTQSQLFDQLLDNAPQVSDQNETNIMHASIVSQPEISQNVEENISILSSLAAATQPISSPTAPAAAQPILSSPVATTQPILSSPVATTQPILSSPIATTQQISPPAAPAATLPISTSEIVNKNIEKLISSADIVSEDEGMQSDDQ